MKTKELKTKMEASKYYIELVTNSGSTYFQLVRRSDQAILFANPSLSTVADKLCRPVWKDGTPVKL